MKIGQRLNFEIKINICGPETHCLFRNMLAYIFRYLKLELERIDIDDALEINESIETNEFLEFLSRLGKNMQNKM